MYVVHSRLRLFAAFRIPEMQELDIFRRYPEYEADPDVDIIRPEIIVDLTVPNAIYKSLESVLPEDQRRSYDEVRLSNITGVQFINPWTLQDDKASESMIPFFVTATNSDETQACLMRYDVTHSAYGSYVNRPILKQVTLTKSPSLEIASPTIIVDDYGTVWGTEGGLLYVIDINRLPTVSGSRSGAVELSQSSINSASHQQRVWTQPTSDSSQIIVHEDLAHTMRHRVGFDYISGRKFKVLRTDITISDYVPRAQARQRSLSGSSASEG